MQELPINQELFDVCKEILEYVRCDRDLSIHAIERLDRVVTRCQEEEARKLSV